MGGVCLMFYNDLPYIGLRFNDDLLIRRLLILSYEDSYGLYPDNSQMITDLYIKYRSYYFDLIERMENMTGSSVNFFEPIIETNNINILREFKQMPNIFKNRDLKLVLEKPVIITDRIICTRRYYMTMVNVSLGYNFLHSRLKYSSFC